MIQPEPVMRGAASVWVSLVGVLAVACKPPGLPSIDRPEELRRDCALLCEQFQVNQARLARDSRYRAEYERGFPVGIVPKEKWPPRILALKPVAVFTSRFGTQIYITGIRGKGSKGYFLPVNTNSLPPSADFGLGPAYLTPSRYDGIWEFVEPDTVL